MGKLWKDPPFLMGKRWKTHYFNGNGHGFNSKLLVYQRVTGYEYPEAQSKSKFRGQSSNGRSIESTSTNPPAGLASNKPSENQKKQIESLKMRILWF